MEPRSLTFSLLFPLLAFVGQGPTAPSPASSPSPSPSPSTVSPPPVHIPYQYHPPPARNRTEHRPGLIPPRLATPKHLNVGEKVGLAFLSVVLVLQLALGGFLLFKRLKLRNMALVGRQIETSSPVGSP